MNTIVRSLVLATAGGFLLTVPFVILEWINTPGFWAMGIPPLFYVMWFVGSIFSLSIGSMILDRKKSQKNPVILLVKAGILILAARIFMGLVIDQWPCFMGVPNCD